MRISAYDELTWQGKPLLGQNLVADAFPDIEEIFY
jgi:hypothetical protein